MTGTRDEARLTPGRDADIRALALETAITYTDKAGKYRRAARDPLIALDASLAREEAERARAELLAEFVERIARNADRISREPLADGLDPELVRDQALVALAAAGARAAPVSDAPRARYGGGVTGTRDEARLAELRQCVRDYGPPSRWMLRDLLAFLDASLAREEAERARAERAEAALVRIAENAAAWHGDDAAKGRALAVIGKESRATLSAQPPGEEAEA